MPTQIYKVNGKRVPGVTTVISANLGWNKQALMWWAWSEGIEGRNYRETAEKAASIGTIAHLMIECDLKNQPFNAEKYDHALVEKAEVSYLAWLEWKDLVSFKMLESEIGLVSEKHKFGGTIDIAAIKKVTSIVDLKTSNGTYPDHLIQISAYGQLWNENYPDNPIQAYYLLRLGKDDGSFHYHFWQSLPEAWECFKYLRSLHGLQSILKKAS